MGHSWNDKWNIKSESKNCIHFYDFKGISDNTLKESSLRTLSGPIFSELIVLWLLYIVLYKLFAKSPFWCRPCIAKISNSMDRIKKAQYSELCSFRRNILLCILDSSLEFQFYVAMVWDLWRSPTNLNKYKNSKYFRYNFGFGEFVLNVWFYVHLRLS